MAYLTANLARVSGANSDSGAMWIYKSVDPIATILAADYISDGDARALKVDDVVIVVDSLLNQSIRALVSAVTSAGAASLINPEIAGAGVVTGSGATVLITAAQSGKTFFFDRAAGIVYTLPPASVGLKYRFETTVDLTAAAYAVLASTSAAGDFFVGAVVGAIEGLATDETHFADGSTHLGISSNKTTTGGLIGGWLEFECLSPTLWSIKGVLSCTATPAVPYTT